MEGQGLDRPPGLQRLRRHVGRPAAEALRLGVLQEARAEQAADRPLHQRHGDDAQRQGERGGGGPVGHHAGKPGQGQPARRRLPRGRQRDHGPALPGPGEQARQARPRRQVPGRDQDHPAVLRGDREGHPGGEGALPRHLRDLRIGPERMISPARVRWRHLDPSIFLWALLVAVLLLLVINPLARLLWTSFQDPDTGALTLGNYAAAYGRWRNVEALINSVVIGLAVAVLCTVFGVPMAWAVSRSDMPGKGLVWAAILGTFIVPNYLGAVAWILLAGPNAGWLNRIWKAL